jgi:hypothetical protein
MPFRFGGRIAGRGRRRDRTCKGGRDLALSMRSSACHSQYDECTGFRDDGLHIESGGDGISIRPERSGERACRDNGDANRRRGEAMAEYCRLAAGCALCGALHAHRAALALFSGLACGARPFGPANSVGAGNADGDARRLDACHSLCGG